MCVTQISPTVFSLSYQSPQTQSETSGTYGAYEQEDHRMECDSSPQGANRDSEKSLSVDFIAVVRIRLRERRGSGGAGGGGKGGKGVGGSDSNTGGISHTADITVEFERQSDFLGVLNELHRALTAVGATAQSDPSSRKMTFNAVEIGNVNHLRSFVDSLCAVFPRPVSVFEA